MAILFARVVEAVNLLNVQRKQPSSNLVTETPQPFAIAKGSTPNLTGRDYPYKGLLLEMSEAGAGRRWNQ
jgi:hypothetical protein